MLKNVTLPSAPMSAMGLYEALVVECPSIPRLRRKAFRIAGLSGNYGGSADDYRKLTDKERSAHDRALSVLVKKNRKLIDANRHHSRIVFTTGQKQNLILDQGLNKLLRSSGAINWSTFSNSCAAGTGTTPTFTDSGATTATSSGTTVTASSSFFTAGMVGQLIKFDSGEERYITAQAGTTCTINSSLTVAAPTLFTVWAVNQTGLASESKRTTTYLTGTGNCGSSVAGAVWSGKRTYDFSAEVGNVNYTELGWSDIASAGSNLNSRTLISGGTVSVLIGQQLRVVYTLQVTASPSVSTPGNYAITGWPVSPATTTDGDYMITTAAFPTINTNGISGGSASFPFDRTSGAPTFSLATGATLPTFGTAYTPGTTATSNTNSLLSYTDGNFFLDAQGVFNLSTGNATNWRGITAGGSSGFVFVFDEAQTKANTHTLTVRARMSVGRTLTNP